MQRYAMSAPSVCASRPRSLPRSFERAPKHWHERAPRLFAVSEAARGNQACKDAQGEKQLQRTLGLAPVCICFYLDAEVG